MLFICIIKKAVDKASLTFISTLVILIFELEITSVISLNIPFLSIVIRHEPGYGGRTTFHPIKENFLVCFSGLGRDTSEIISDKGWVEIINSAALGIQFDEVSLRSAIKIGRLFTEKSGLINKNISEIFDSTPMGSVCTVAHLGTSIIAISDDLLKLSESLEKFGEIRKY